MRIAGGDPLAEGLRNAEDLVGIFQQQGLVAFATGIPITILRIFIREAAVHDEEDAFAAKAAEGQEEVVDVAYAGEDHHPADEQFQ